MFHGRFLPGAANGLAARAITGSFDEKENNYDKQQPATSYAVALNAILGFFEAHPLAASVPFSPGHDASREESLPRASAKCCNFSRKGGAMKEIADLLHVPERTLAFHKYNHGTPWRQDERRAGAICFRAWNVEKADVTLHVIAVVF